MDVHSPDLHTGGSHGVKMLLSSCTDLIKLHTLSDENNLSETVRKKTPRTSLERPSSTSQPFYALKDGEHRCRRGYRDGAVIPIRSL